MHRIMLSIFACLAWTVPFCAVQCRAADAAKLESDQTMSYAERVTAIDRNVGDLFSYEALLGYEPFVLLASEGAHNVDKSIGLLAANGHSHEQRAIAILSMHRLTLPEYVGFLRKVAHLFDQHLVSQVELGLAVVPGNAFSTVLIENYNKKEVRDVLEEIAVRRGVGAITSSAIESVLSGKAWDGVKAFRRNCCTPRN
jgi:hypothetical protein